MLCALCRSYIRQTTVHGYDLSTAAAKLGFSYNAAAILAKRARDRFHAVWTQPYP